MNTALKQLEMFYIILRSNNLRRPRTHWPPTQAYFFKIRSLAKNLSFLVQANNCVEKIWRGNLKNCWGRIICFATVSIWYRGSSLNLVSVVVLVRVGFLLITKQKHCYFSALLLNFWIDFIETNPSIVMVVTYAWKNVLKENISADLIRDMMSAASVGR